MHYGSVQYSMSNSLSPPWIKPTVQKLLDGPVSGNFRQKFLGKRTVQVINVYSELNIIVVSDKEIYIAVALTSAALQHLQNQDAFSTLAKLRFSIVKIQDWHVTTVAQCVDARQVQNVVQAGVLMPMALQCDSVEFLGGDDCVTFGSPVDINKIQDVRQRLMELNYAVLLRQLAAAQFPNEDSLPNAGESSTP